MDDDGGMTWGDMINFMKEINPELLTKKVKVLNNDTDNVYYVDFVEFVEENDVLPVGEIALLLGNHSKAD